MNAVTFDTLETFRQLKSIGFTDPQAEAVVRKLQEAATEDHLLTRNYLKGELEKVEMRLVLKLGTMIVALGGLVVAVECFG